jgi:hypothetical protein
MEENKIKKLLCEIVQDLKIKDKKMEKKFFYVKSGIDDNFKLIDFNEVYFISGVEKGNYKLKVHFKNGSIVELGLSQQGFDEFLDKYSC